MFPFSPFHCAKFYIEDPGRQPWQMPKQWPSPGQFLSDPDFALGLVFFSRTSQCVPRTSFCGLFLSFGFFQNAVFPIPSQMEMGAAIQVGATRILLPRPFPSPVFAFLTCFFFFCAFAASR